MTMVYEGEAVARYLASQGITAFLLKYRTRPTPANESLFGLYLASLFVAGANSPISIPGFAVEDARLAMQRIRTNASNWKVNPNRIGMLGFSAGAMTSLSVTLENDAATRPAFLGYIYGPMTRVEVPDEAPPMYAALAEDDPLFGGQGTELIDAWSAAGNLVEYHSFPEGSHGFGIRPDRKPGLIWPDQFVQWVFGLSVSPAAED